MTEVKIYRNDWHPHCNTFNHKLITFFELGLMLMNNSLSPVVTCISIGVIILNIKPIYYNIPIIYLVCLLLYSSIMQIYVAYISFTHVRKRSSPSWWFNIMELLASHVVFFLFFFYEPVITNWGSMFLFSFYCFLVLRITLLKITHNLNPSVLTKFVRIEKQSCLHRTWQLLCCLRFLDGVAFFAVL